MTLEQLQEKQKKEFDNDEGLEIAIDRIWGDGSWQGVFPDDVFNIFLTQATKESYELGKKEGEELLRLELIPQSVARRNPKPKSFHDKLMEIIQA